MTEASKTPAGAVLVRKILQLEQQRSVRAQFGPVLKAMGEDIEDDESEEELIEQLRDVLRQEKSLAKRINRIRARRA
ncbi:MAG: hypothetical protein HPY61_01655 [Methanotrichaceae archaeon]|nr:hypothetical protein [Methanotrichaceae archaeon]